MTTNTDGNHLPYMEYSQIWHLMSAQNFGDQGYRLLKNMILDFRKIFGNLGILHLQQLIFLKSTTKTIYICTYTINLWSQNNFLIDVATSLCKMVGVTFEPCDLSRNHMSPTLLVWWGVGFTIDQPKNPLWALLPSLLHLGHPSLLWPLQLWDLDVDLIGLSWTNLLLLRFWEVLQEVSFLIAVITGVGLLLALALIDVHGCWGIWGWGGHVSIQLRECTWLSQINCFSLANPLWRQSRLWTTIFQLSIPVLALVVGYP